MARKFGSWSRIMGFCGISTALLLGCAQLLGLEEDVRPSACRVDLDCAPSQICADGFCGVAADDGGENSGGSGSSQAGQASRAAAGAAGETTSGGSGSGGSAVTGDAGGGSMGDGPGGQVPECSSPEECPGTDNDCGARTCTAGKCGLSMERQGTVVSRQVAGDCQKAICDGNGAVVSEADDTDEPAGGNSCMLETCMNGVPMHDPAPTTTSCGATNQFKCDGKGACGGCTKNSDCGLDNLCATYACNANTCKNTFVASGQGNLANTPGDCKKNVCDGMGSPVAIADGTDLPRDNNPCTKDVCTMGAPSHPYESSTKACGAYSTCNGTGTCICSDPASSACPRLGAQCGNVTNGCGQSVTCPNTCNDGINTCNGAGNPNACGCTANAYICPDGQCAGRISDGCGHTKECAVDCETACPDNCQTRSCMTNGAIGTCYCANCNG